MEILRIGSRGAHVEALQLALTRAGYQPGAIDGIFGGRTQSAVLQFQSDHNLLADGIVGPRTQEALAPYLRGYVIHTIAKGDTLYRLSRQYGTTLYAIVQANPSADAFRLRIGQQLVIPFAFPVVPVGIRYTSYLTEQIINGLQHRYPFLQTFIIGRSMMGRPLWGVRIGQGETEISYNASHHANEWINTPVLLKFLEDYSSSYASGRNIGDFDARDLYNKTSLFLIPLVNPDGVDLVNGAIPVSNPFYKQARSYADNYPTIPFPDGWKANINGVDLNLNYPAGWENAKEIKYRQGYNKPGPRDFVGSNALSEPESQAMYNFTLSHSFALVLAYHTQGQEIYWKYLDMRPPRAQQIGQAFANASGYALVDTPYESGFAGYKDWFILQYNLPGYTIESGIGENPLPLNQFDEIFRDNLGVFLLGLALA